MSSGHLIADLHGCLKKQLDEKKAEPNFSLGKAINYMLNHWSKLTLFLRIEKAPLDNNICERSSHFTSEKLAGLQNRAWGIHRQFFHSLIHTCFLGKINPFEYLRTLQKHHTNLIAQPYRWMPWNYQENLGATRLLSGIRLTPLLQILKYPVMEKLSQERTGRHLSWYQAHRSGGQHPERCYFDVTKVAISNRQFMTFLRRR